MKNLIFLLLVIFIATSCGSNVAKTAVEPAPAKKYFSGEYLYFADATTFKDCATGVNLAVASEGASLDTERAYTKMGGGTGTAIFMECIGRIELRSSMEESMGNVPTLIIDSLIGFNQMVGCNPNFVVVGIYEKVDTLGKRENLQLRSNYTFTRRIFDRDSDKQKTINGLWYRGSEMELYLLDTTKKDSTSWMKLMIDGIIPEVLTTKDSVSYKKVYL